MATAVSTEKQLLIVSPQTSKSRRLKSNFPGLGIGSGPRVARGKNNAGIEVMERGRIVADENGQMVRQAPSSLIRRMRDRYVKLMVFAASRSIVPVMNRPKVSPTAGLEVSTANIDFTLTKPEKQYLDYVRRAMAEGQFSNYLMPAK